MSNTQPKITRNAGHQSTETRKPQPILAFFQTWWGCCLCLSDHRCKGCLLSNISWLNHGRKQSLIILRFKSHRKKQSSQMYKVFLARSIRQWEFQIQAVHDKRLWLLVTISGFTWVIVLLWSYQCCHYHSYHHNSTRHTRRKHERQRYWSKRKMKFQTQETVLHFSADEDLLSGRSWVRFVNRISPRRRAHPHHKCLGAKHFLSRQLLFMWYHLCRGLSKSTRGGGHFPWAPTLPPSSIAGGHLGWGIAGAKALRSRELQPEAASSVAHWGKWEGNRLCHSWRQILLVKHPTLNPVEAS